MIAKPCIMHEAVAPNPSQSSTTTFRRLAVLLTPLTQNFFRYCDMSNPSQASQSESFRFLFEAALQDYEKKTGTKLVDHPLAKQLEKCDSVGSITYALQDQAQVFRKFQGDDGRVMKSLKCSVDVLYTLSTNAALGEGIGLVRLKALVALLYSDGHSTAIPACESDLCGHRHPTRRMSSFFVPMRTSL
jgi:hypothetical protein